MAVLHNILLITLITVNVVIFMFAVHEARLTLAARDHCDAARELEKWLENHSSIVPDALMGHVRFRELARQVLETYDSWEKLSKKDAKDVYAKSLFPLRDQLFEKSP